LGQEYHDGKPQSSARRRGENIFAGDDSFRRHSAPNRLKAVQQGRCETELGAKRSGRRRQIKIWRFEMKTIQRLAILAGLSMMVFALSATGAKAQAISTANFSGTFNLPVAAQWGKMTLPAGTYNLYYGRLHDGDINVVEVAGKAKGSPHGLILATGNDDVSAANSSLVCIREGDALIVRALEMPAIGTSAQFSMPKGTQLEATNRNHNGYTQLAEAPRLIERIPVAFNAK
jgi:hypothetical protein